MAHLSLEKLSELKCRLEYCGSHWAHLLREIEDILKELQSVFAGESSEVLFDRAKESMFQSKETIELLNNLIEYLDYIDSCYRTCAGPGMEMEDVEDERIETAELDITKVQFSAVAPRTFMKGDYSLINIVMYEDEFRYIVDDLKNEAEVPAQEAKSGVYSVGENDSIKIVLSSPDIEIEDNVEELVWTGGYLNFSYVICVPETYEKRQLLFIATVYVNGVAVTKLKIVAKSISLREQKIETIRNDVLSAFVSYASQDRSTVARLIQGMKKVSPNMDVFLDVEELRSGEDWEKALKREIEKRDVFFLCWSNNAKQSSWVDMEWRYALANKGIEGIEPIPLEPPTQCPPPEELKRKHFNDSLLYIINESKHNSLADMI